MHKTRRKYIPKEIEKSWPNSVPQSGTSMGKPNFAKATMGKPNSAKATMGKPNSAKATMGKQELRKYLPKTIEEKWQQIWMDKKVYQFKLDRTKKPYYTLVELPYPSGNLHIGHWFTFATADAHARHRRMAGWNVFFPNGFDAFGLPAENAAIKRGIHPKDWTMSNIETMRKQFDSMGSMIDWSHQAITCLPEYYRWNQWIFIKMFERGLAYRGKTLSNWCPSCQTVLANEGIEDGKCWRCGSIVEQKEIEQWFLKITAYADRLVWKQDQSSVLGSQLSDISQSVNQSAGKLKTGKPESENGQLKTDYWNGVDWPQSVREGQNNWIGRSEGLEIDFKLEGGDEKLTVFTVYPETIFGVTYMVLAPEHLLAKKLATKEQKKAVDEYIKTARNKTEMERKTLDKEKTGVFTGAYCINPVNGAKIPIWIADYVIATYGTGAVMGVPGSDDRDFAFASRYNLAVIRVIGNDPKDTGEVTKEDDVLEEGYLVNSGEFSGLSTPEPAKEKVKDYLEQKGSGRRIVQYHLHDWSVSRQRYWGTPLPIIYCDKCWELKTQNSKLKSEYGRDYTEIDGKEHAIIPVPLENLPVELPYEVDYTPKGKPPLATAEEWMQVTCPKCGGKAKRDPETLDTFFDSSWYFYRYLDPKYDKEPFNPDLASGLTPVDIYFGGAEHTLGHTLYARFFTKFFHDIGLLEYEEFAKKRIQHGVILGPDGFRMSKSRGNVIDPDDVVREYGADTVRLFLCFMMPYEATAPWNPAAISGIYRFLRRIWDLGEKVRTSNFELRTSDLYHMHRTIKKVGSDIEGIHMNTAIATLMEWLNYLSAKEKISKEEYKTMLLLLAPFAPHIAEELWQSLRDLQVHTDEKTDSHGSEKISSFNPRESIHAQAWPVYKDEYMVSDQITIVVQVNGRVRENLTVASALRDDKEALSEKAQALENVKKHIAGKQIKTVVYVPGRIINFVVA
ncbi:MAG: leucine--tRNA ligase [Candidatus Levybacteria bacterium]|nr:leucine--tRNA ligase [Candidatus Levybacteria bacterium]